MASEAQRMGRVAVKLSEHGFHAEPGVFCGTPVVTLPLNYHNVEAVLASKETMPMGAGRARLLELQKKWDRKEQMPPVDTTLAMVEVIKAAAPSTGLGKFLVGHKLHCVFQNDRLILQPTPPKA